MFSPRNPLLLFAIASIFLGKPTWSGAQEPPAAPVDKQADTQQLWYGTMEAYNRLFRFVVTTHDGSDRGTLLSLDEGSQKFELTEVAVTEESFQFKLPFSKAAYSSQLSDTDDGQKASGKWAQAGVEFDLELVQVDAPPQEALQAYWTGKLDAVIQKLDVAFRERADGIVLFDSLTQKSGGFISNKQVDGNKITFDVPAIKGTFTGELNADGTEIVGKWKQGLLPLSLTLTKTEPKNAAPAAAAARPQMPQAPFPYDIEEVAVENTEAAGVKLAGTLTIPKSEAPVPAVILISGSGPQDRDETIADHKPFWVIADYLTRQGIAVLRFDDRGVGQSTGDFAPATSVDFASDAAALVTFLRQHKRIAADKIVLCGHSEGGLVAPMAAARDPKIAGLILLAGPGVDGEQILISQARLIMEAGGIAEEEVAKQAKIQKLMIDLAKRDPALGQAEFNAEANKVLQDMLTEKELTSEQTTPLIEQASTQLNTPWFRYFLTYDPATALSKVRCPVLVLNGELDLQVEPKLNVGAIEATFKQSGFTDYETHVIPRLNHLFQTAKTGNITEYGDLEETFSPKALELMSDWLKRKL